MPSRGRQPLNPTPADLAPQRPSSVGKYARSFASNREWAVLLALTRRRLQPRRQLATSTISSACSQICRTTAGASSQPVDGRYILPMKRQVVRQARPIRQLLFEDGHDPFAAPSRFSRRHRQLRTCSTSLRSTSSRSQKFPITLQSRCAKSRAGTGFERNGEHSLGSLIVCRLLVDRTANLNFLGDRSYAIDALDRAFGRDLLRHSWRRVR